MPDSSPRTLSALESLPVEVLQNIFLASLELNLPRASLPIAQSLSSPLIYTWLIRVAFSSLNDGSRHAFFTPDFLPPPLDPFLLTPTDRTRLQNAILSCRWCTLDLIRRCQREYILHTLRHKCSHLILSPTDTHLLSHLDPYFQPTRLQQMDRAQNGRRGRGDIILSCRTRQDPGQERKLAIWFHFGAVQIRSPSPVFYEIDMFRLPTCAVDSPPRIPDKLLSYPLTDEKFEFLTLLAPEAYLDEDDRFERAQNLLRTLIQKRDIQAFTRLLNLHIRTPAYSYTVEWPVRPPVFRAVMRHAEPQDDPFVEVLVEKKWHEIPENARGQLMANLSLPEVGGERAVDDPGS
jgi:hypothetical protein